MSESPPKASGKWSRRMLATLIVFACYETVHYATYGFVTEMDTDLVCRVYDEHVLGGRQVPLWAERYFFWPADRIDELIQIRGRPWHQWRE
ncbi:MAG TPA: hypothetical protein VMR25_00130 [Planctomycetaceae bacterium]|jgi:hypothetical protein|nr:hypothetical protein [Planctomycetaceae bacterium]